MCFINVKKDQIYRQKCTVQKPAWENNLLIKKSWFLKMQFNIAILIKANILEQALYGSSS